MAEEVVAPGVKVLQMAAEDLVVVGEEGEKVREAGVEAQVMGAEETEIMAPDLDRDRPWVAPKILS